MNSNYKSILKYFVSDLQEKHANHITTEMLEEELINIACLFVLGKGHIDTDDVSPKFYAVLQDTNSVISQGFAEAAVDLYPTLYGEREAAAGILGISQNITWGGMWSHLRNYFMRKHNLDITNNDFWND